MSAAAFHFGYLAGHGHCLQDAGGWCLSLRNPKKSISDFPWTDGLLDAGLLKNGNITDQIDGRVYWTCGGKLRHWFAFYWWDRSGDRRPNSNSGFYVVGFDRGHRSSAFNFACAAFPKIVQRQTFPLCLSSDRDGDIEYLRRFGDEGLSFPTTQR